MTKTCRPALAERSGHRYDDARVHGGIGAADFVRIWFDGQPEPQPDWVVSANGTVLTGSDERGPVIRLTLVAPSSIAANADGTLTVTAELLANFDTHPGLNIDDLFNLGTVTVVATDASGDRSRHVAVFVSDDFPSSLDAGASRSDGFGRRAFERNRRLQRWQSRVRRNRLRRRSVGARWLADGAVQFRRRCAADVLVCDHDEPACRRCSRMASSWPTRSTATC